MLLVGFHVASNTEFFWVFNLLELIWTLWGLFLIAVHMDGGLSNSVQALLFTCFSKQKHSSVYCIC